MTSNEPMCPVNGCDKVRELKKDVEALKATVAEHNILFAKINVKLNGILWGIGVTATAVIGVLIRMLFPAVS